MLKIQKNKKYIVYNDHFKVLVIVNDIEVKLDDTTYYGVILYIYKTKTIHTIPQDCRLSDTGMLREHIKVEELSTIDVQSNKKRNKKNE